MYDAGPLHTLVMALSAIVVLLFAWGLVRVINNAKNSLQWEHLVSVRAADGTQYADWNRIGQGLGVVLCVWLPAVYVYSPKMDAGGLAMVMGVALAYLGGVAGYASTLRAKQGSVETSKVTTESAGTTVVDKVVETAPIAPKAEVKKK